jgi:hypothetical protein
MRVVRINRERNKHKSVPAHRTLQEDTLKIPFFIISLFLCTAQITPAFSQQPKVRIGIYDSRCIAVAYANSKFFNNPFSNLGPRMKAAKENNDTKEIAKIEMEGKMRQAILHDQGFGKGSVNVILETYKEKINAVAKEYKLDLIVSRWEVMYQGSNLELVDITEKMAGLFEPSDEVKQTIKEMPNHEPVKDAFFIED